ncbi:Krueppel homolog 2 [Anopheles arabiensis]|uniref:Protein Kr-h2 n=7 Tax=gambiae species complex TaxID=44542 RepID=A0A1S4H3B3_ANOGA|nr:Krueppel homolog 2 [Anopheles arabiensis]XP_040232073.1 Krueppel homolog 2 [Anopheles coluzzii]XP_040232074.1 Krueppel homolog 2 [Anopheles coluzzii]XP_041777918.1 Krueppel homolog 2 [Anopheles merus]XP_041777919.1 Krueppel homolog 2 [Anopheles merus]XP_061515830.1 Krueppel homolog 2 isoform X1 [Anopheles gambiae]XP_061515832.1 Krueppel homolog 2 isoform X1 [Anopheles gambiae]
MSDQQRDQQSQQRQTGFAALKEHVLANKLETTQWVSRVLTIYFALGYVLPFLYGNSVNAYYKVLMANAATSAIRLHQRLPPFTLSRAYLQQTMLEDSFHYLLFSLIFLYVYPLLVIILPVILFSLLHSTSYSLTLLDTLGQNSWWGARLLISVVEFQTRNILRLAACSEILIMPITVLLVFFGKAGIMTPLVYYQFLVMRYSSRRNPYTRNMFYEFRLVAENFANGASTPPVLRKGLHAAIGFISRLAPPTVVQPQQQGQ